jgi:hypothetical protein
VRGDDRGCHSTLRIVSVSTRWPTISSRLCTESTRGLRVEFRVGGLRFADRKCVSIRSAKSFAVLPFGSRVCGARSRMSEWLESLNQVEDNRRLREAAASESGTPISELDESDIIASADDEFLCSEALALWTMIRKARVLAGST